MLEQEHVREKMEHPSRHGQGDIVVMVRGGAVVYAVLIW